MENCLSYLSKKGYNKFGYILLVSFALIGTVVIAAAAALDSKATLQCNPDETLVASHSSTKEYIETQCLLEYAQKFQPFLPVYILITLNFGSVLLLSIFYSLSVKDRVEIFAPSNDFESERQRILAISKVAMEKNKKNGRCTVFIIYIVHLIFCRIVPLVVFSAMLLRSSNFPVQFNCSWPSQTMSTTSQTTNYSTVECTYPMGSKRENLSTTAVAINFVFVTLVFFELAYLLWSSRKHWKFYTDIEFCCVYLLNKRKPIQELINEIRKNISDKNFCLHDDFGEERLSDRELEKMYINVMIQEGREKIEDTLAFTSNVKDRHEIYTARYKLPPDAVTIKKPEDLFQPMAEVCQPPRTILIVGRPGIGKTLLTKKLLYQWKKQTFKFWHNRIVIVIRFREFNKTEGRTSLQEMFQRHSYGFNESTDPNHIHEFISFMPSKAVLIFDGLDELKVDRETLAEEIPVKSHSEVAHVLQIYRQLVKGELLPGTTVLTTSRPTAEHIYLNLKFDRKVEVIGFHEEQIKEYVEKFCDKDKQKSSQIWDFIKQSPELLGLCYIPVNSYIVCLTLKESIAAEGETNAPRTITELYKRAINILLFKHHREYMNKPIPKNYITGKLPEQLQNDLNKLKKIARNGMIENKLIFEFENEDEFAAKLSEDCGLFNKLEDKRQNYFCFLHLTIQEFLAALHVVDDMNNVESFLFEYIDNPQWHLVIQFVFGLLGDKMRELEKDKNVLKR